MEEKKAPTIKIGGREIPLFYSTYEMIAIERELQCTAFQLKDTVLGYRLKDEEDPSSVEFDLVKDPEKKERLGKLITILGNAGLEEAGEEADLTEKWVMRHMKPGLVLVYGMAAVAVVQEGNTMMAKAEEEEKGPVDVTLEEENAKKQPGS